MSRLDDKARAGVVIVMQRLHVNDLTGYVEGRGGYHKLALSAVARVDEVVPLRRGRLHRRLAGEPLQPQREGLAVLDQLQRDIGAFNFAAQYQQSPRTPEGTLFKRKWFLIEKPPYPTPHGEVFIGIDSVLSTSSTADYSALTMSYIADRKLYVRAERGRWDYETLKRNTLDLINQASRKLKLTTTVVVERAGSGISLHQYLTAERRVRGDFDVFDYSPKTDKISRAAATLPVIERVGIRLAQPGTKDNYWIQPYLNEFMNFPTGSNDDQVDSLVVLLNWNRVRRLLGMYEAE